jgi:peptidoglycan/xylan/chitin deacetylase (PgdA/CDA1 family)
MYHAVGDTKQIGGADPHYAVTAKQFEKQIEAIAESIPLAHQVDNDSKISTHCITFDDGHISNYLVAFPILKKHGLAAEFYVNSSTVGTGCYMSWQQLEEMHKAGMSIQSHGHTHSYFSDMTDEQIESELQTSKQMIEQRLGNRVTVFAPPGGRIDKRVVKAAKHIGYECIATSRPGLVSCSALFEVPRFAIIKTTTTARVKAWKKSMSQETLKEVIRFNVFRIAKLVLGNHRYEKMRARLLGDDGTQMS